MTSFVAVLNHAAFVNPELLNVMSEYFERLIDFEWWVEARFMCRVELDSLLDRFANVVRVDSKLLVGGNVL